MKRSVGIEYKLVLVATVVVFVLIALTEPGMALLLGLLVAAGAVFFRIEEKPPRWLLRSPLGRWLRHRERGSR
jgi:hypothetical protein